MTIDGRTMSVYHDAMGQHPKAPSPRITMKAIFGADWAPHLKSTARSVASVAVAFYVAGLMLGEWVHRLNAQLAAWASAKHQPPAPVDEDHGMRVYFQAAEPTRVSAIAPPSPILALAAQGMSQRQIAAELGITRYQVRKELAQ